MTYQPKNPIRIVTAASLFDGHDVAINIMRRLMQQLGAEVIHLGHNRSAKEVVDCAIAENAQGIALTSYQGGHVEYFRYVVQLLKEAGAKTKVFGGGGGTILPSEADEMHGFGVTRVYSPDDGRKMGLVGMIEDVVTQCDFAIVDDDWKSRMKNLSSSSPQQLAELISICENFPKDRAAIVDAAKKVTSQPVPILGITGTGGAGKSSLVDELVRRFLTIEDLKIGVISVDPTRRRSGGALLGDRIRMNSIANNRVYMRSLATRSANAAVSESLPAVIEVVKASGVDLCIVETSGIGQSDSAIVDLSDTSLYVMTPEFGAASQLEKIDMLDYASAIAINKSDKRGAQDSLRDVRKQYRRNRNLFDVEDETLPVFSTVASQFGDTGTTDLFYRLVEMLSEFGLSKTNAKVVRDVATSTRAIVPPKRQRYLAEIAEASRREDSEIKKEQEFASNACAVAKTMELQGGSHITPAGAVDGQPLAELYNEQLDKLRPETRKQLTSWPALVDAYSGEEYSYQVRGKTIKQPLTKETLAGSKVKRVVLPALKDWGDIVHFQSKENVPGAYPYTAGVFPLKRVGEDPARMFAGEGGAERTNKRFHYLSQGQPAKRLSTAFDSVTLYGEDPEERLDIYGKIGNSGVSIATVDDAKRLYSGFELTNPKTSVSMTINGPAPMLLAYFLHAAIDQECEKYLAENGQLASAKEKIASMYDGNAPQYFGDIPSGSDGLGTQLLGASGAQILDADVYEKLKAKALSSVRGTVQADILKEDQAQNTCIFSTEFALRMMGDVQQYFIDHSVRNFYSVSVSGYHIAEAGANPITQLAFTLANGFTLVEYYLSRGMAVDEFAPNFSYFFSNGLDPEYAVIGRVARRIWARAIKNLYGGNSRAQKLKYHIQTSGRSLHAQEIAFNDIRTTLQALYAIYDNCNSLHTNAYDEAITTPTEDSVRRALAIQLIINKELGLTINENPLQGAFIISELTDLVEEAVLQEFERISERGGVLGAMERMYQRTKIQEESMKYEGQKHSGALPIIGVNTFLGKDGSPTIIPDEVIRSGEDEKKRSISRTEAFRVHHASEAKGRLEDLRKAAVSGRNVFEALMAAAPYCSLGQLSSALYEVGGQYRRNM